MNPNTPKDWGVFCYFPRNGRKPLHAGQAWVSLAARLFCAPRLSAEQEVRLKDYS